MDITNAFESKSTICELLDADNEKYVRGINELKWAFPKKYNSNPNSNISVRKMRSSFKISFRKGTTKKFNSDRLIFAIDGKRIYFAENEEGYKLGITSNPNSDIRVIRTRLRDLTDFIGDYVLQYDGDRRLYYIDRANMTGEGY